MKLRIILFGAGASFGAVSVQPKPPPLGGDLFEPLHRLYPQTWGQIPNDLAYEFKDNFERGMDIIIEKYGFAVGPLMQDMAKFFSMFSAGNDDTNLYFQLLQDAKENDYLGELLLSTINYECILETAAWRAGLKVNYFADIPVGIDTVAVWKLHGSCNFKLKGLEASRGIKYSGVTFDGTIEPLQLGAIRSYYSSNTALYPAMALYAKGKTVSIAPTIITNAQKKWKDLVMGASMITVIGVNPNPDDGHIWNPLAQTNAELVYVGDTTAFDNWRRDSRANRKSVVIGARWRDASGDLIEYLRNSG